MSSIILGRAVFGKEIVTGTRLERVTATEIRDIFKEYKADEVVLQKVPVLSWNEVECYIEALGERMRCYSLPYTLSSDIEAELVYGKYTGNRLALSRSPEGRIVILPFPIDPDDVKFVILKLARAGALATIFYDELPGRYRRIVVTGVEGFPYNYGSPPPIPAVSIMKEQYLRIFKRAHRRLRIYIKAFVEHNSTGYNIVAYYNGSREREVHWTAHHDHWFTGYSDNRIGVETILRLARRIKDYDRRYIHVLISFTAEESGAPGYAGWYWSWGSRYLLKDYLVRGKLDNIALAINIDAVFAGNPSIATNPFLYRLVSKLCKDFNCTNITMDNPVFDSFSYTNIGIPALTIHTLGELLVNYHTNLDDGRECPQDLPEIVENIVSVLYANIEDTDEDKLYSLKIPSTMLPPLKEFFPIETRLLLTKLFDLNSLDGKCDKHSLIHLLTKYLIDVVATYGINGIFEAKLLPEIHVLAESIHSLLYRGKLEPTNYYISGVEEKILDKEISLSSNREEILYSLLVYLRNISETYMELVNSAIRDSLLTSSSGG